MYEKLNRGFPKVFNLFFNKLLDITCIISMNNNDNKILFTCISEESIKNIFFIEISNIQTLIGEKRKIFNIIIKLRIANSEFDEHV